MNKMTNISASQNEYSPEEITRLGQDFYLKVLKDKLERTNNGDYAVIEVQSKDYYVDKDLVNALDKAKKKYPEKLFFIVQIGTLKSPILNLKKGKYAWAF